MARLVESAARGDQSREIADAERSCQTITLSQTGCTALGERRQALSGVREALFARELQYD